MFLCAAGAVVRFMLEKVFDKHGVRSELLSNSGNSLIVEEMLCDAAQHLYNLAYLLGVVDARGLEQLDVGAEIPYAEGMANRCVGAT